MFFSTLSLLTLLSTFVDHDLRLNAEGGYCPTAGVLGQRIMRLAEDRMMQLAREIGGADVWSEQAYERVGFTFHVGHRTAVGAEKTAIEARIAHALRKQKIKARIDGGALYVTLDSDLAANARAAHGAYVKMLAARGAKLPGWALDIAGAA